MYNYYTTQYQYSSSVSSTYHVQEKVSSPPAVSKITEELKDFHCSPIPSNQNQTPLTATGAIVALKKDVSYVSKDTSNIQNEIDMKEANMKSNSEDYSSGYSFAWRRLDNEENNNSLLESSFSSRKMLCNNNDEFKKGKAYNFDEILSCEKRIDGESPSEGSQSTNLLSVSSITNQTYEMGGGTRPTTLSRNSLDSQSLTKSDFFHNIDSEEPDDLLIRRKCQNQRKGKENIVLGLISRMQNDPYLQETKLYKENTSLTPNMISGYSDEDKLKTLCELKTTTQCEEFNNLSIAEKRAVWFLTSLINSSVTLTDSIRFVFF